MDNEFKSLYHENFGIYFPTKGLILTPKISVEDSQILIDGLETIKKFAEVVTRLELDHGQIHMENLNEFIQRFESLEHGKRIRELTTELQQTLPID